MRALQKLACIYPFTLTLGRENQSWQIIPVAANTGRAVHSVWKRADLLLATHLSFS
jgi:hypothetical protein